MSDTLLDPADEMLATHTKPKSKPTTAEDLQITKLIAERIATQLKVRPIQVASAIMLLDEGASVPFISRYRKEATGGLDDTQLRALEEQLNYGRELEARRKAVIDSITEQGKMTDELKAALITAQTKQEVEDLYLPYKPKRRTKAQIAREAGLEPLALALLANPNLTPEDEAQKYINTEAEEKEKLVPDVKAALDGAKHILTEKFAEEAKLLDKLRRYLNDNGHLIAKVVEGKEEAGAKFRDWFNFKELLSTIPSHRALALFRGRAEDILRLDIKTAAEIDENNEKILGKVSPCEGIIAEHFHIEQKGRPADKWLDSVVHWCWAVKLSLQIEVELMSSLRERAEEEAIKVFAKNLHSLLLSAPAGAKVTMGLDPGIRTGVKVAVVDQTGKLVDTATIYPHEPKRDWDGSLATLGKLIQKHKVQLIAIGNGTASRETDKLAADIIKLIHQHDGTKVAKIVVSEAGASVYSASELAAKEFPNVDVSIRGAVSIARRLQDPLAELVKIDPKSIGVGQYQHDVNQSRLAKSLDAVVEDCVNAVGVDVNMASVKLLMRVSGLNSSLAENIVNFRETNGAFTSREALKKIPRMGGKTFEQAAGFLRITDGDNPLDASAVHPESYPLVEKILADIGKRAEAIIGDSASLKKVQPEKFINEQFGLPTIRDILKELEKPGRDPRPEFVTANFSEGVEAITDLKPGMTVEGVITNVTNFGAFVDIGVHQDGLVHISALSSTYVKDPHSVVKAGDVVKVKVLEVDVPRRRIALTMRLSDEPSQMIKPGAGNSANSGNNGNRNFSGKKNYSSGASTSSASAPMGALAEAFARAKNK